MKKEIIAMGVGVAALAGTGFLLTKNEVPQMTEDVPSIRVASDCEDATASSTQEVGGDVFCGSEAVPVR